MISFVEGLVSSLFQAQTVELVVADPLEALIVLGVGYIVLSVAGSAIVELTFQLLRARGRIMANVIRALLGSGTDDFYRLPTVRSLQQMGFLRPTAARAYSRLALEGSASERSSRRRANPVSVDFIDSKTFAQAFATLASASSLPEELVGEDSPFSYRGGEIQLGRVQHWFDEAMRGTKRQYRRSVQLALFGFGFLTAWAVELDSVAILRQGFLGTDVSQATWPIVGYLVTAGAVALGSQYWFDLVGRLLGLRTQLTTQGIGWGRPARRPGPRTS